VPRRTVHRWQKRRPGTSGGGKAALAKQRRSMPEEPLVSSAGVPDNQERLSDDGLVVCGSCGLTLASNRAVEPGFTAAMYIPEVALTAR
jgi:hypothetical protein